MKIKLPDNETILYALAISQTFGMTYASVLYESAANNPVLLTIAILRGLLGGGAISFTLAVGAQKVPRIGSARARKLAYLFGGLLLLVVPVIMAPAIFETMPGNIDYTIRVVVSICFAVAPDFAAVIVATQSGALQSAEQPKSDTQAKPASRKRSAKAAPAVACPHSCGRSGSQNAINAHVRNCVNNPANMPIPVGVRQ